MAVGITVVLHALMLFVIFRMIDIKAAEVVPPAIIEITFEPEPEPEKRQPVRQQMASHVVTGKKVMDEVPPEPTKKADYGDHGDVEKPIEKPIEIDERSLFRSQEDGELVDNASGKQENATALVSTPNMSDFPSFSLDGRSMQGKLVQPSNTSNQAGKIVVEIYVNQQGKVTKATVRTKGTTIQNETLWRAAERAASQASFNSDAKKPPTQIGSITYVFKLR
jgi:TonB family protein